LEKERRKGRERTTARGRAAVTRRETAVIKGEGEGEKKGGSDRSPVTLLGAEKGKRKERFEGPPEPCARPAGEVEERKKEGRGPILCGEKSVKERTQPTRPCLADHLGKRTPWRGGGREEGKRGKKASASYPILRGSKGK